MSPACLDTVRVEALFVSDVGLFDTLTPTTVHNAVLDSVRRYGPRGCSERVAAEFDRRPERAVPRMSWVRGAIRAVYPVRPITPPRKPPTSPIAA
ncbi:MAG: hypothetical protein HKP61_18925 [Dactylosporangium sp.]|nr:hypothetical protein [Dactylosporangium sp.]NNJ62963.1 hypothetical protein [Dactylosporangium sp.]